MPELFERIRSAVEEDRYLIGLHAANRLEERGILDWQAVAGLSEGTLIVERPYDHPNPAVEVEQLLPDGTPFNAVWSWLPDSQVAKLVTVHFFDR